MKIFVIKNNIHIGTLTEDIKGSITFNYSNNIDKNQYLIGLANKTNTSNTLFPVFENLLPEHEQLELIKVKHHIKRKIDLLLYLDNIHGSFEFYTESEFLALSSKKEDIFIYSDVKEEILENNYTFPNILDYELDIPEDRLYPTGLTGNGKVIGLSGFQYKFSVNKNDMQRKILFCDNGYSDYIMKPYNMHYSKFTPKNKDSVYIPYLLVNEHIFMTLARDFNFDIPYNGIIKHNEDYHYIIKRYDRYHGLKIDHCEVLTLLDKRSSQKYEVSCQEVMDSVLKYLNNNEVLQLFRFLVFSIVISHGDLHAKNISLIYKSNAIDEKKMTLAPNYDISTTKIYKSIENQNDIGMMIKNKKRKIILEDLLWLADTIKIDNNIAKSVIHDISSRFIAEFKTYIQRLPQSIRMLPVYRKRSIYNHFDTFEEIFNKYYEDRCKYIRESLLYDKDTSNDSIWK